MSHFPQLYKFLITEKLFTCNNFQNFLASYNLKEANFLELMLDHNIINLQQYEKYNEYTIKENIEHLAENISKQFTTTEYIQHDFLCFEKQEKTIFYTAKITQQLQNIISRKELKNQVIYLIEKQPLNQFIIDHLLNNEEKLRAILPLENKFSAKKIATFSYKFFIFISFILALILVFTLPKIFVLNLIVLTFLTDQIFKFSSIVSGIFNNFTHKFRPFNYNLSTKIYTILIPLYKEKNMVPNIIKNLQQIDYDPVKLDIIFLLEKDDLDTIKQVAKYSHNTNNIRYLIIPNYAPQTKPKALNYGLIFAKGKFITIFDAEDNPHPLQLKQAASKFYFNNEKLACVQARLTYINYNHNLLTKLFYIEYAIWFSFMIPGIANLQMPVPLGGTSNHFKVKFLRLIGGWDSYNVTEDADIGIRLYLHGYKTKTIRSYTYEQSPTTFKCWIKQRSRWIKGFFQTFIVCASNLPLMLIKLTPKNIISLFIFIGLQPLLFLFTPLFVGYVTINSDILKTDSSLLLLMQLSLILTYFIPMLLIIYISIKRKIYQLLPLKLIYPFYFLLHSLAAFIAMWELFFKPFYWHKTQHSSKIYKK